jgi:hypothetical protein
MGGAIGAQIARGQQPGSPFNPQAGLGPPPLPGAGRFHYSGPGGQGEYEATRIAQLIQQDRAGSHLVWATGWPAWKPWTEVPEVARLVPPPSAGGGVLFHYAGPDGQKVELAPADIAARVKADPAGRHLVWREGMSGWTNATEVPDIARLLASGPPPVPGGGPPPLPT